jgi:uncharacterized protein (TIGR02145 family)
MKNVLSVLTLSTVLMSSAYAQDTVQVKTGWNIIGSVKAGAIPDVLTTFPDSIITTSFYGYTPGTGYQSTDTLGKGLGYWVKVKADGIIIYQTSASNQCGVMRVDIGGFSYGTVLIGDQCWLDENSNVGTMILGATEQTNNATLEKYCYENDIVNCALYGGLYQWNEVMQYSTTEGAQGICPPGWHVPTMAELQTLKTNVSGDGNALKKSNIGSWDGEGTNTSGFSALLAGVRRTSDGFFLVIGSMTDFWSSTENGGTNAVALNMSGGISSISIISSGSSKQWGYSVRCLQD